MRLSRLRLTNFRNHAKTDVQFHPGVNILLGENGQGKTNVVEAAYFLAAHHSHRTTSSLPLIRTGEPSAVLVGEFTHQQRSVAADVALNRDSPNKARVNGNALPLRELSRHIHSVMFAPEDIEIIDGDPEVRRGFIDDVVCMLSPRMIAQFADYDRVLRQRNSLLKSLRGVPSARADLSTLLVWNDKLVELGVDITLARVAAVQNLRLPLRNAHAHITDTSLPVDIRLASKISANISEDSSADSLSRLFRQTLEERRRDELDRGVTLVGPHRDDLALELKGLPLKGFASQGEKWTFALALKLAVAELVRDDKLGDPVLILDDVFAQLDDTRRNRIADAIAGFEQIIITAAVEDDLPHFSSRHVWDVSEGTVSPRGTHGG